MIDESAHVLARNSPTDHARIVHHEISSHTTSDASHRTCSDDDLPARARRKMSQAPAVESEFGSLAGVRHSSVGRLASHRTSPGNTPGSRNKRVGLTAFALASAARRTHAPRSAPLRRIPTGVIRQGQLRKTCWRNDLRSSQHCNPGNQYYQWLREYL